MPRRTKKVPSYRHHKGTGQAVVTLSGKDVYLGNHGTEASHEMYRQVIAEWLANHQQPPASSSTGALPESDLIDVNQLFVAYWKYAQTYYVKDGKPTRELSNIKDAARPLIELFGSAWVKDFRPSSLKAVRQEMIDADLSRKTINNRINRIPTQIAAQSPYASCSGLCTLYLPIFVSHLGCCFQCGCLYSATWPVGFVRLSTAGLRNFQFLIPSSLTACPASGESQERLLALIGLQSSKKQWKRPCLSRMNPASDPCDGSLTAMPMFLPGLPSVRSSST